MVSYLERQLAPTLQRALRGFPAVLVTGPRQSGKTTFLRHEAGPDTAYVSFDDPLERDFALSDPSGFLARFGEGPVILDEIQYVPALLSHLKLRIDAAPERLGRWLLTGSQQFGLMRDVSESLAGRVAVLELPPFGQLEHPAPDLETAVWAGGYPVPALYPDRRDLWMSSYLATYLERDVRQVKNIPDLRAFGQFLALAAARHGQEFHKADLARELGISQPTVAGWASVLDASYVIHFLPPYHRNYGKRVVKTPKLYFLDPALACTLTRQPSGAAALAGPLGGALLDGWVVSEAVKVYTALGQKPDIHFWRSHDGLEVDLIVRSVGKLVPVEIKLTATPGVGHVQPIQRFKALAQADGAGRGILVCRVDTPRPLPGDNLALPWSEFPGWLRRGLE